MTAFGDQLRTFRQRCHDSKSPQGKLTQEKFGTLVGIELGIQGYTGAAVSDWERGKTRIDADDRRLLRVMIKVLYEYRGVRTIDEANQLLKAGNFRNFDLIEEKTIFTSTTSDTEAEQEERLLVSQQAQASVLSGGSQVNPVPPSAQEPEQSSSVQKTSKPSFLSLSGNLLPIPADELQELIGKAEEGPSPSWPRLLVSLTRRFTDRFSIVQAFKLVLWIWVWLLTWVLVMPSLRWPFSDRDAALLAIVEYAAGSILIPALIGALTNTNDTEFWRDQKSVSVINLRLYTQQGASVGFHVAYFFIFMIGLLLYTFGWRSMTWIELVCAAFLAALGYAGARLVPYNLYAAFKQLSLKDGRIFFIFLLVGPAWGYFFLETYDILLAKSQGIFIVLSSLTILLAMMAWRYRQNGTTMIPLRWWVIFWLSFLLCELLLFWLGQVM
jgi:hypothetical protein